MSSLTPEQRAQIRALLDADEQGVPVTEWYEFRLNISSGRWSRVSRFVTYADMIARSTAPAPHYRQYRRRSTRGGEMSENVVPNPGSDEAVKQGCTCPVLDNAHGRGAWGTSGDNAIFFIHEHCRLHNSGASVYHPRVREVRP